MTAPLTPPKARPSDVVCPAHLTLTHLPVGGLKAVLNACSDCTEAFLSVADRNGQCWVGIDHGWTADWMHTLDAHHEAGHAVVACLTGHQITEAVIHTADHLGDDGQPHGGYVSWNAQGVAPVDNLTAFWAGQEAGLRWLAGAGQDTPQNRFDQIYGANHDAAMVHELARQHRVSATAAKAAAAALVTREWERIERFASQLIVRGRIAGSEVHNLIGV